MNTRDLTRAREEELSKEYFSMNMIALEELRWDDSILSLGHQAITDIPYQEQERDELVEWLASEDEDGSRNYASKRLARVEEIIAARFRVLRILKAGLVGEEIV